MSTFYVTALQVLEHMFLFVEEKMKCSGALNPAFQNSRHLVTCFLKAFSYLHFLVVYLKQLLWFSALRKEGGFQSVGFQKATSMCCQTSLCEFLSCVYMVGFHINAFFELT